MSTHTWKATNIPTHPELIYCRPLFLAKGKGLVRRTKRNVGVKSKSLSYLIIKSLSIVRIQYNKATVTVLRPWFVGVHNNSIKSCFHMLQSIETYPFKNQTFHTTGLNVNCRTTVSLLDSLLRLGYIQVSGRPRRITMLQRFTVDDVYTVSKRGHEVLKAVYEAIGLM